MAISLQEELNKRNKDTRPYWVQFDEAAKAKSKKNKELREKGDKAANLAKAKNFTQQGITYSNLGFPATNIVDPSQARETAVRNELLRRENIENKQKAVNARRDSNLKSFNEWEKLAQRDDLESEEFAEKGRIFAEFGGDGTFIQERVDSINSLLESGVLSKEAEVGLTNTLEALVAAEGSFKESREQVFNIPDETVSNVEIENQYNPGELEDIKSDNVSGVTSKQALDNQSSSLKISEAERKLGSTPWQRKSLMDSPRAANEATWKLLEEEGYDLRGVQDKDRLAADYRLGRLNKTDKGLWYENKFLRNR
tara:strand:+ start:43 stop:975 length:933 start_codon:yes stop_codon:yes gene_type:complete